MTYKNLILGLVLSVPSIQASAEVWKGKGSPNQNDCDQIIGQSSTTQSSLGSRASEVERCLDLVEDITAAAYRNTLPYCKNLALANNSPSQIIIGGIEGVVPTNTPVSGSWEDYAMSLGDGAASAGCRDGIFSALQQILFTDVEKVRTVFRNGYLELNDQFKGNYDVKALTGGLVRSLKIDSSLMTAQFTSFDQLRLDSSSNIVFEAIPVVSDLQLSGSASSFFGATPVDAGASIVALLYGTLNHRTLEVTVSDYQIQSIDVGDSSPAGQAIEAFLKANFQDHKPMVTKNVSQELTARLKQAYNETDPFEFLSGQEVE